MGADDFIRKPFSQRLLVERVKAVLRCSAPKDPTVAPKENNAKALDRGLLRMDPERHTCTWKNEPVALTVTEFLILQALATRPGVVKSRNALMDAAYDDQVYVDDRTIDSHIKRLRKKFKVVDNEFGDDRDTLRRRLPLQGSLRLHAPSRKTESIAGSRSIGTGMALAIGDFAGRPRGWCQPHPSRARRNRRAPESSSTR